MSGSSSSARDADATPLEPVGLTVHAMPVPTELRQRTRAGRWKMLLVLVVCAAPVLASYFTFFVVRPQGGNSYSDLIQPTRALPAWTLADADGRPVALSSLRGQWLLIAVGGGACDAGCEQRLYLQRQLREMTGRDRDRIDKLWLVTDDVALRPALRAALDAAPPVTVLRVARDQLAGWLQPAPGATLDEHLYLVDPMGEWMLRTPRDADPSRLKRDLERLLRASASWDLPGR